jgi:hypothetical protein
LINAPLVSSAACRSRTGENAIIPLEPEARFEIWNDWEASLKLQNVRTG